MKELNITNSQMHYGSVFYDNKFYLPADNGLNVFTDDGRLKKVYLKNKDLPATLFEIGPNKKGFTCIDQNTVFWFFNNDKIKKSTVNLKKDYGLAIENAIFEITKKYIFVIKGEELSVFKNEPALSNILKIDSSKYKKNLKNKYELIINKKIYNVLLLKDELNYLLNNNIVSFDKFKKRIVSDIKDSKIYSVKKNSYISIFNKNNKLINSFDIKEGIEDYNIDSEDNIWVFCSNKKIKYIYKSFITVKRNKHNYISAFMSQGTEIWKSSSKNLYIENVSGDSFTIIKNKKKFNNCIKVGNKLILSNGNIWDLVSKRGELVHDYRFSRFVFYQNDKLYFATYTAINYKRIGSPYNRPLGTIYLDDRPKNYCILSDSLFVVNTNKFIYLINNKNDSIIKKIEISNAFYRLVNIENSLYIIYYNEHKIFLTNFKKTINVPFINDNYRILSVHTFGNNIVIVTDNLILLYKMDNENCKLLNIIKSRELSKETIIHSHINNKILVLISSNSIFSLDLSVFNKTQEINVVFPKSEDKLKYQYNKPINISILNKKFNLDFENSLVFYKLKKASTQLSDWEFIDKSAITLAGLDEGNYSFLYKYSSNTDNLNVKKIDFKIIKPFWDSNKPFKIIFFISLFLLAFLVFYRYRLLKNNLQLNLHQMSNVNKSLNPHFLFNCLTSLQALHLINNEDDFDNYLQKFKHYLRVSLAIFDEPLVGLNIECEFLRNYLKLEQERLGDRLQLSFSEFDEKVLSSFQLPPMLLQPIAENSIKHNSQLSSICIEVNIIIPNKKSLIIDIVDNGRGYTGTVDNGHGLKTVEKLIKLSNEILKNQIIEWEVFHKNAQFTNRFTFKIK